MIFFYSFDVASDGYYKIALFFGDDYYELVPWSETSEIKPGYSENHLRADCVGSLLTLYANDKLLAQVEDHELSAGNIGLTAGTFDTPGVDIRFDNFRAIEP